MVEDSSCGENFMRSGVEAAHRLLQQQAQENQDPQQCSSCGKHSHLGSTWREVLAEVTSYLSGSRPRRSTSWCLSRPELADYGLNLWWVQAQMEHHVGRHKPSKSPQPLHSGGTEMQMAAWARCCKTPPNERENAQEPSLLRHLQGECAKLAAGGGWDGVNRVERGDLGSVEREEERKGTGMRKISRAKGTSLKNCGLATAEMGSTELISLRSLWSSKSPLQKPGCRDGCHGSGQQRQGKGPVPRWNQ